MEQECLSVAGSSAKPNLIAPKRRTASCATVDLPCRARGVFTFNDSRAGDFRELPLRESYGWRQIAMALAKLATFCAFAWAGSMSEGSSRMLLTSEATNPQAPKKSVGIFVGINIFERLIAH
jgi:hypothetical protein